MININVLEKTLAIWPGISLHFGWRKNKKTKVNTFAFYVPYVSCGETLEIAAYTFNAKV